MAARMRMILASGASGLTFLATLGLVGAASAQGRRSAPPPADRIYEVNITKDLWASSGEPQIALDPLNHNNIAIIEFRRGVPEFPVYEAPDRARSATLPYGSSDGDISLSSDGGNTWTKLGRPSPMNIPPITGGNPARKGGGDPFIAYGPGVLYAGHEASAVDPMPGYPLPLPNNAFVIVTSTDHGKTWSAPRVTGTPIDRPWLTTDASTGKMYSVSSGHLNFADGTHNIPGPDAINDRWLLAWGPNLESKSEARRIGGPDFAGTAGNTITAAHGVVAATFVLGPPTFYIGPEAQRPPVTTAVPASLRKIVPPEVTECTQSAPCLFFQTSDQDGLAWKRRYVPVPGGFEARRANVAADPGKPGRFAIGLTSADRKHSIVMLTDDSGETWQGPFTIPETADGVNFKGWMAYAPNGVLGMMWKEQRDDLPMPPPPPRAEGAGFVQGNIERGFDVYVSVACDGGKTWQPAVKVNAVTSPPGISRTDDLSYVVLDNRNVHMVWGDRRIYPQIKNAPGGTGGTHTFYGRAPFSAITKGAPCGGR